MHIGWEDKVDSIFEIHDRTIPVNRDISPNRLGFASS